MPKVTVKPVGDKGQRPEKPYPDFPLFPCGNGQWGKKILGKRFYFGVWADPDAALAKYEREREARYAGRTPKPPTDGVRIHNIINQFLNAKRELVAAGELTQRSFDDYEATGKRIASVFGRDRVAKDLGAEDFEKLRAHIAKQWGPVALGNEVNRVRIIFKYGFDAGLLDAPIRFGPHFKRPSKKTLRKARHEKGPRLFQAAEIHALLKVASDQVKAMILLGVNAGFGNADVGTLPLKALDLDGGWVNYPRPKTGIMRRVPLWRETVKALRAAIKARPAPKDSVDANLAFLTKYGHRWAKETRDSPVSKEITKLLIEARLNRPGLNFYALRHTLQTIGEGARDPAAVAAIMGHAPLGNDMSAVYREGVNDDRLKAVTKHVHDWLFAKPKQKKKSRRKTVKS